MSAALLTIFVGLGQGLLHGLGPDHCAAVATLGTIDRRKGAAVRIAFRFALGHALVLGLLAAICLSAGVALSESFATWAEVLGGGVLVALAATAMFFPSTLQHGHPHVGPHGPDHRHVPPMSKVGVAAGALMALSGVRALLLALPPLVMGGSFSAAAWVYLPAFTLGVMGSMVAVGLAVGRSVAWMGERFLVDLQRVVAVGAGALGVFWIVSRL